MSHLRLGNSLDKCVDMGAIVDPSQKKSIDEFVQDAKSSGAEVFQSCASMPDTGCFYPPTLVTNVQPVSRIVQEEVKLATQACVHCVHSCSTVGQNWFQ